MLSLGSYGEMSRRSVKNLDRKTEIELTKRWQSGDRDAAEQLVAACLPFVISIAVEYRRWGLPLEDIAQEGAIGLLRAARKFDPQKECRLTTYAGYWIRAEIREYLVRAYRVVRLGTTKCERRALRAYRTTKETDPEALALASGLTVERATAILPILSAREASLDAVTDDHAPLADRLEAAGPTPEFEAARNEASAQAGLLIATALKALDDRERLIVRERLMTDSPMTLEAIGTVLGVSKERVRQLEERARAKLQLSLESLRESAHC